MNVTPNEKVKHKQDELELQISQTQTQIKLEGSQAICGTIMPPVKMDLCGKTSEGFYVFCKIQVVTIDQLYGG
ncbi:hypothetical protein [Kriegella aquimaris]|uniref:Uncharacterized protein n=1 Tax=Kriegella aquimaris TaxID=192904 RepID=A0A1G9XW63_9FLAO|nr:hypothetical protein [Kriegella aquimaris]SDN00483.1 hypothetical protein SAMN04488514_11926 [Kriegella aquimaris]